MQLRKFSFFYLVFIISLCVSHCKLILEKSVKSTKRL